MGIRALSLFFGGQVPLPAPLEMSEALERVEVESAIGERGTFRLTFRADEHAPQDALLPESGRLTRVSLVLREGSHASVIMEGVAVVHTLASGADGKTSLVVSGEDLTRVMDLVMVDQSFPGMPLDTRVLVLLAKYAVFGVVPLVIPPLGSMAPSQPFDSARNGLRLYPSARGHRGVPVHPGSRLGSRIVDRLLGTRASPRSGTGVSDGLRPAPRRDRATELRRERAARNAPTTGACRDGRRHVGRRTRRRPVALRRGRRRCGAGKPFDGLFHVNRVRHTITRDTHTQAFELKRAGGGP